MFLFSGFTSFLCFIFVLFLKRGQLIFYTHLFCHGMDRVRVISRPWLHFVLTRRHEPSLICHFPTVSSAAHVNIIELTRHLIVYCYRRLVNTRPDLSKC
ncbi:hypothetical protein BDW66DRAFT_25625 [Aspergillus desertorum]